MSEVGNRLLGFCITYPQNGSKCGEPLPECREAFCRPIFARIEANSMSLQFAAHYVKASIKQTIGPLLDN
jgi:hypothetical protein